MRAEMKYSDERLKSVENTIDNLQLLYDVKQMDKSQALLELDYKLIDKLIDIFSYEKYADNFSYNNICIINKNFDLECWVELSRKQMGYELLEHYLLEVYFKPAAKKLTEAFNDANLVASFDRLRQVGLICLFLEMDEFFTHFIEKTEEGEIKLVNYMSVLMPSTVDLCEMRSELFN